MNALNYTIAGAMVVAIFVTYPTYAEGKSLRKWIGAGIAAGTAKAAISAPTYCLRKVSATVCRKSFNSLQQAETAISPLKMRATSDPDLFEIINAAYQVVEIIQILRND
jgi:hypothetical protein